MRKCKNPKCDKEVTANDSRTVYCCRACSASVNNTKFPKRKRTSDRHYNSCSCGRRKMIRSKNCRVCLDEHIWEKQGNKTKEDVTIDTLGSCKYNHIRAMAKKVLARSERRKECQICRFDYIVHACHIKAIKDFDSKSKLSEINHLSNLIYLCPNHHAMFDLGLIKLEE